MSFLAKNIERDALKRAVTFTYDIDDLVLVVGKVIAPSFSGRGVEIDFSTENYSCRSFNVPVEAVKDVIQRPLQEEIVLTPENIHRASPGTWVISPTGKAYQKITDGSRPSGYHWRSSDNGMLFNDEHMVGPGSPEFTVKWVPKDKVSSSA